MAGFNNYLQYNQQNEQNIKISQEWSLTTDMSHEMTEGSKKQQHKKQSFIKPKLLYSTWSNDLKELNKNHIRENRP